MDIHLRTTGCRLPYGITQYHLPPTQELQPVKAAFDLPTPKGWKAELT